MDRNEGFSAGEAARLVDAIGFGRLGNGDQNMRQLVLEARIGIDVARNEFVDLGLADAGVALAVLARQRRNGQFAAHGLAVVGVIDAVVQQSLAKLGQAQPILPGQPLHGLVELAVGDLDAAALGLLHQQRIVDQLLQHLAAQHVDGRNAAIVAAYLDAHQADAVVELALGDRTLVDDGDDAVEQ